MRTWKISSVSDMKVSSLRFVFLVLEGVRKASKDGQKSYEVVMSMNPSDQYATKDAIVTLRSWQYLAT